MVGSLVLAEILMGKAQNIDSLDHINALILGSCVPISKSRTM